MQEPLTLYKLMILYLIDTSDTPLSKTMISDCIIDLGYTDYMTVQTAIGELKEGGFLEIVSEGKTSYVRITSDGQQTLSLFMGNLNEGIRKDITGYLSGHNKELRDATSVAANYKRTQNGEYEAKLVAKNRGVNLIELNLTVPDEDIASSVCDNWLKSSAEVYAYLTEKLF
ncbi:MAG: DUF4364 family protein [Lachnospiraceae bacterium]|nr:DUF4364 family protein [Lachnospiraceae bacterium]